MQVRTDIHESRLVFLKEQSEISERYLDEDDKQFFKLFTESTFEGSKAAALKMKKYAEQQIKNNQEFLLFHSLSFLAHADSKMLSWPNSPVLVLLKFVDPNVLSGDEPDARETPLHLLADLADPSDYSTHTNQLILAKQLIEHGANVDALSKPHGKTPLHNACYAGVVTNLDFVEFLLEAGADPNAQAFMGVTPLMLTTPYAPGAAKFLLNWPATDANITDQSGESFLVRVRSLITAFSDQIAPATGQVQHQFLHQQWRVIEELLVESGAHDTGISA
jgi:hypothetical protein